MKTITRSEYLQAFALYTLAISVRQRLDDYEVEMNKILGLEAPCYTGSRVSDGFYSGPPEPFDLVLGYADIQVEPVQSADEAATAMAACEYWNGEKSLSDEASAVTSKEG